MNRPDPDYPEYLDLRAGAERRAGPFVDPVDVNFRIPNLVQRRGSDWAYAVLGRPYGGASSLFGSDMELLKLADERGLDPPLPVHVLEARRAAREREEAERAALAERIRRLDEEWAALVAALPVPVVVAHNYKSGRHCENGYVQGGDHILVEDAALVVGRFGRMKGQALCETRSNRDSLYFPGSMAPTERRPTCKRCIRRACQVTGRSAPAMLGEPAAGARAGIPNRQFVGTRPSR